jgi:hypothetical protein
VADRIAFILTGENSILARAQSLAVCVGAERATSSSHVLRNDPDHPRPNILQLAGFKKYAASGWNRCVGQNRTTGGDANQMRALARELVGFEARP